MTEAEADAVAFLALTEKIARERGFAAPSYKDGCLRRRISVRMRARGVTDYAAYSALLDSDAGEFEQLLDALTINVTKLFRNPDVWEAVATQIIPPLWATDAPRLTTWVAGCSSGEEAYTLAALWHRHATAAGAVPSRARIVASDIDRASLEAAAAGAYEEPAFVETPAMMRERYFPRDSTCAGRAHDDLRALITFERRDLLEQAPPAGPLHLVSCRNVIIYFDRASQDALFHRAHEALAPGGFLLLGKVETLLGPARSLFEVVDQRQRIFRRV
jgi:chemotaxis methyl-accepting protein methylase